MAQYYSVSGQDDSNTEEVAQLYHNLEENQTVQYVIASDGSQPQIIGGQPVVVSSEQLMVVEGQSQQVIIDQSQVVYQPSSYVIQDASGLDFQNNQQVYYMTNTPPTQSVVVEQSIAPQPVVLNHQIMSNAKLNIVNTLSSNCTTATITTPIIQEKIMPLVQQIRSQQPQQKSVRQNVTIASQKQTTHETTKQIIQDFTGIEKNNEEEEDDMVQLSDGRWVNYTQYKKAVAHQKQLMQDRLAANMQQCKPKPIAPNPKPRFSKAKQQRTSRPSSFQEKSSHGKTNPQEQQFENAMPQRPARAQESQNRYLIQPKARDSKPPVQRPLPQFLHSSQIQNIIDSTPKSEEYSDSIRMLVLLDNGEQRLITFTLPKEACTIQEILEQVGVPFTKDTPIQVSEANSNGLNYIVAVGHIPGFSLEAQQLDESSASQEGEYNQQMTSESEASVADLQRSSPSPEPPKEMPPKLVEGQLALCAICGYLSEDFNRCLRCKRKLPDNVKAIPAVNNNGKKVDVRGTDKRLTLPKTNGIPRMNLLPKKRPLRSKLLECETVVVSSDEEEGDDKKSPYKDVTEHLMEKLGNGITISPISKEPSIVDIQKTSIAAIAKLMSEKETTLDHVDSTNIVCRTIRIGSYRFMPPTPVRIDSFGLHIKVRHPKLDTTVKVIKVDNSEIVKVLVSFQKSLPVLFYYLVPAAGVAIREVLDMTDGSDLYFDPLSETNESHKRITLLPEILTEECKQTILKLYSKAGMFDELTYKEANDILIKTCPKEVSRTVMNYISEIKPILMYPPEGRGRITINTEDYMCLGQDQFLNDVIIDFYLKYLLLNMPKEQQDKVHIFSTFFYKRLTTKPMRASRKAQPMELDPNLSAAQKRHCRVKTWTKNVNIFDKDFIVIPINENCHWFLAIICFPNMNGSQTMDGQPIKIEPKQSRKKKIAQAATAVMKEKKEAQSILCEEPDLSDKDEAEGDESELDSDDSEESPPTVSVENNSKRPPIKQPCILIFDSLAGASRSRVVATLRDYLTCEYKAKLNQDKVYTKDVIKGACPKVPQQTNFTDCGLYLLQYVEQFFKDPIKDYYIPINHLKVWFEEIIVTKKREDISLLIKSLMKESGKDWGVLPDVSFPTLNGELVEDHGLAEKEDNFMDPDEMDDEGMEEEEEEEDERYISAGKKSEDSDTSEEKLGNKSTFESDKDKCGPSEQTVNINIIKPELSELPKQSCKDTLSYLKAKRISRHKNVAVKNEEEGPDAKKVKSSDPTSDYQ